MRCCPWRLSDDKWKFHETSRFHGSPFSDRFIHFTLSCIGVKPAKWIITLLEFSLVRRSINGKLGQLFLVSETCASILPEMYEWKNEQSQKCARMHSHTRKCIDASWSVWISKKIHHVLFSFSFPLFHSLCMYVIVMLASCLFIYSLNPCLNAIENRLLLDGMKSLDVRPHSFKQFDSSSAARSSFPKATATITSRWSAVLIYLYFSSQI